MRALLPWFPFAGITVHHLLTHTSGLPDMLPENDDLRRRQVKQALQDLRGRHRRAIDRRHHHLALHRDAVAQQMKQDAEKRSAEMDARLNALGADIEVTSAAVPALVAQLSGPTGSKVLR